MEQKTFRECASSFLSKNYLDISLDARKARENKYRILLEKKKIPDTGWNDSEIEEFIFYLSSLDMNNFPKVCGLGEREGRIASSLVARRHYNFAHGIGRSGDLLESQPKAAGSTILSKLGNALLLDLIKFIGVKSVLDCFLVPMATGMTLNLCFLALKKLKPKGKYVLWSRIDQKSCFKSITTAELIPIIIDMKNSENGLITDIESFKNYIKNLGVENIICIFSTTSCFAPRNCDNIIELANLAQYHDIFHIVNNAYGLQSTFFSHQIEQSSKKGKVDIFVQSTDKNLLVPVGGAIVAGFDEKILKCISQTYVGRASSSQMLDVVITLLSLGKNGYKQLISQRKNIFDHLSNCLKDFATTYHGVLITSKQNPISIALRLDCIDEDNITKLGSMLFTRGVSGSRVISARESKEIDSYIFKRWGCHTSTEFKTGYLTAAAALGITSEEVDKFIGKLKECFKKLSNK